MKQRLKMTRKFTRKILENNLKIVLKMAVLRKNKYKLSDKI